jgi:hypothetical protein
MFSRSRKKRFWANILVKIIVDVAVAVITTAILAVL